MDRTCSKIDECMKVDMILDKDILGFQAAELIREICDKCERKDHANLEEDLWMTVKVMLDENPVLRARVLHYLTQSG